MEKMGTLIINKFQPNYEEDVNEVFYSCLDDYSLSISLDENTTLEDALNNKKMLDAHFRNEIKIIQDFNEFEEPEEQEENKKRIKKIEKKWKYFRNNFSKLIDLFEFVSFEDESKIGKYLEEYPKLRDKNIVLGIILDISDYDKLVEIEEKYNDIKEKIYVKMDGNTDYINLDECRKTIMSVKNTAMRIKSLNLSPIETMMYTYDFVRERIYTFEDENQKATASRDLTRVLFGDKIVCVGYTVLFNALLKYMGFENVNESSLYSDSTGVGHARTVLYLQDPKYNIDGIYYFDPTWDSRRKDGSKSYLSSYKYFAKTNDYIIKQATYLDLKNEIEPLCSDDYEEIKELLYERNYTKIIMSSYVKRIQYCSKLIFNERIKELNDPMSIKNLTNKQIEDIVGKIYKIIGHFESEIPAETMIEVYKNVRKIEYYQNPEYFPYDMENLVDTIMKSEWNFDSIEGLPDYLLLFKCFGEENKKVRIESLRNYYHKNKDSLEKEVAQVKLTRTLRNYVNNKNNS